MRLPGDEKWSFAIWKKQAGPRSYKVLCGNQKYRRNRRRLRSTSKKNLRNFPTSLDGEQALSGITSPVQVVEPQPESAGSPVQSPRIFPSAASIAEASLPRDPVEPFIGPPRARWSTSVRRVPDRLQVGKTNWSETIYSYLHIQYSWTLVLFLKSLIYLALNEEGCDD